MNRIFKNPEGDLYWGWKAYILIVGAILYDVIINTIAMTVLTIGYSAQGLLIEFLVILTALLIVFWTAKSTSRNHETRW